MQLTAVYMPVPGGFVAFVEELPGVNTQGATLDEARKNLVEAARLVLNANRQLVEQRIAGLEVIRESLTVVARPTIHKSQIPVIVDDPDRVADWWTPEDDAIMEEIANYRRGSHQGPRDGLV